MKRSISLISPVLLLIPVLTQAAETATKSEPARQLASSPLSAASLLQTLMGLFLVLGVIALMAFLLRRSSHFYGMGNGQMRVVASLSLGPRERAIVVQVGQQQVMLGVSQQQINTLLVLDKPLDTPSDPTAESGFAERLRKIMQQQKASS